MTSGAYSVVGVTHDREFAPMTVFWLIVWKARLVVWLANLKHDALVRRSVNVAVFSSISNHVEGDRFAYVCIQWALVGDAHLTSCQEG
jgi:hypothetical protein